MYLYLFYILIIMDMTRNVFIENVLKNQVIHNQALKPPGLGSQ